MLATPHILQTTTLHSAILPITVARDEIREVMEPGIREVLAALTAQSVAPNGPWFTHHRRRPTDTFDFEISMPVAAPIAAAGRVQPGEWPAMKVARTIYHGPYEGLGEAWSEFMDWLEAAGHERTPDLYERYLTGPEASSDPSTWRTELSQPLRG